MPDRFEAVTRVRHGQTRSCIRDNLTGNVAVFLPGGIEDLVSGGVEALAVALNDGTDRPGLYQWSPDVATTTAAHLADTK